MDNVKNVDGLNGLFEENTPRTTKNFKDVQLAFFEGGVQAVRILVESGVASPAVVARAAKELNGHPLVGATLVSLQEYVNEISVSPSKGGRGKGKRPPISGESRTYKAQQTKASPSPFLRLNLSSIGVAKGEEVTATFEGDAIIVRRK